MLHAPSKQLAVRDAILTPSVEQVYTFRKKIGEGAFSKVYFVEQTRTHKPFAIKHIDKRKLRDHKAYVRLQNEISILKECRHKSVLALFEVYLSDSHISLVTEFCAGGDLFQKIYDESPFTEFLSAKIFKQIMEAVDFLHDKGITHRDLKPENILFRTREENSPIVLADFGFSYKHNSREKFMHSDVGTPDYAAPEILRLSYTNAVDLWAAGCILYCMLYALPPFCAENGAETLRKITRGDPIEFFDDINVSTEAQNLILGMLNRNSQERLTAKQVLNNPWLVKMTSSLNIEKKPSALRRTGSTEQSMALRYAFNVVIDRECKEEEEQDNEKDIEQEVPQNEEVMHIDNTEQLPHPPVHKKTNVPDVFFKNLMDQASTLRRSM